MIHFFPTYSKDAADTPFGQALRDSGVAHRIIAGAIDMTYRSRWRLALVCLPRLAGFALRAAIRSLLGSTPAPDAVVLGSDIEVLVFGLVRALAFRRRTRIILGSFILTARDDPWLERLRHLWFAAVLRLTDLVIVHSRLEAETYQRRFAGSGTKFAFVPWGTTLAMRNLLADIPACATPVIVAAGRSGRDYATLSRAVQGLRADTRIICDYASAVKDIPATAGLAILADCHGLAYFQQLHLAALIVIPLAVETISAGQMVLVQAKGLGKAIVVTAAPTIRDYATDGHDAVMVPRGDEAALRAAITRLLDDPAERDRLGGNALASYAAGFTTEHSVACLLQTIARQIPAIAPAKVPAC